MKKIINKLPCRIFGHKWLATGYVKQINGVFMYPAGLWKCEYTCSRCGRSQIVEINFDDYSANGWKWYGGYGSMVSDHSTIVDGES